LAFSNIYEVGGWRCLGKTNSRSNGLADPARSRLRSHRFPVIHGSTTFWLSVTYTRSGRGAASARPTAAQIASQIQRDLACGRIAFPSFTDQLRSVVKFSDDFSRAGVGVCV